MMAASASLERLVPMMAFCEAPFDGILDGTSAQSSSPPAGGSAPTASGDDAATRRGELMKKVAKQFPLTSQRREQAQQEKVVDGLAIFETIALQ